MGEAGGRAGPVWRDRVRRPLAWVVVALAWIVVLPLAGLAAARVVRFEHRSTLVAAQALTQLVYLPAHLALVVGVFFRRRLLTAVAGAVVVAHLVWIVPELRPARPAAVPPSAPRLRVLTANILYDNGDVGSLVSDLRRWSPHLVLVQELSPVNLEALRRSRVLDAYPFSVVSPRPSPLGIGMWSRLPLADAGEWTLAGSPMLRATVSVSGRPVVVANVHTRAPFGAGGRPAWETQLREMTATLGREGRPAVVAGDFNATWGHRPFRELLAGAGLRDAHVERGRGWAVTWPHGRWPVPPLVRLDHVLVSPSFAVTGVREGQAGGSDHLPVVADLALVG